MGEVKKERILEILDGYDKENITIATLGSHTSLHILNGAKEEGFRTAIVCEKGREVPYERFGKYVVRKFSKLRLRRADRVIAPTTKVEKTLRGYGLKNEIDVVPSGVSLKQHNYTMTPEERQNNLTDMIVIALNAVEEIENGR